jgi:hypothetical protein
MPPGILNQLRAGPGGREVHITLTMLLRTCGFQDWLQAAEIEQKGEFIAKAPEYLIEEKDWPPRPWEG